MNVNLDGDGDLAWTLTAWTPRQLDRRSNVRAARAARLTAYVHVAVAVKVHVHD